MNKIARNFLKKSKYIAKSAISVLKFKRVEPIVHPTDNENMLKGKTALIIGGSGGIGFAIAKSFVESGCQVIISGTNEKKLQDCCNKLGNNSKYVVMNLLNVKEIREGIKSAVKLFGKIDILVNSAGIHSTAMISDFLDVTEEEYDSILGINLKGTYFVCQEISNYMIENKIKGHILNISSSVALEPAWSPYRLSKWGVKGFTAGLAQKLIQYGIVVNAIAPGSTATSMLGVKEGDSIYTDDNPVGRFIMPDEVASYAKMMVSDLGNMVVGDTLYISGGRGTIDVR